MTTLYGYKRADGRYGIRNHVIVLPSVGCCNGVIDKIKQRVPEVVTLMHAYGCGRGPADTALHHKTFFNVATHPNISAVLIVALGCEILNTPQLYEDIKAAGQKVAYLNIQQTGGTYKTADAAVPILQRFLAEAASEKRVPFDISELTVGLQCGGSDAFSGSTANSAVGIACDKLIEQGGRVIITETTELIGTLDILKSRAKDEKVAADLERIISQRYKLVERCMGDQADFVIAPGNMAGGMTTIQEKSLGCVIKGGHTTINQVVDNGTIPDEKGLVVMDATGYDTESTTAVVSGGSQMVLFTTGRGNPFGFPTVPVMKIASTTQLYERMKDDVDINAGKIVEGTSIEDLGAEIFEEMIAVANGKKTKPEENDTMGIMSIYCTTPSL
ncbi:MAG: UxaA family hydrolase [Eubacteriales bacterium]|jgi:altronate dehydratase large subunit